MAALCGRLLAKRLGVSRRKAIVGFTVGAALAPLGLAVFVAVSPLATAAAPMPDPRGPHETIALATGSKIALWRFPGATAHPRRTPVVFLHGGPGFYAKPRDFAMGATFRKGGFSTLYYDQPGSGASADLALTDYTVARQVADLEALRQHLGAEKLILWGESWGASLGAYYARAHPDRVAAMIAQSPGEYPGQPLVDFDMSPTNARGGFTPPPRMAVLYLLLENAPQLADQWITQADHHQFNNSVWIANRSSAGIRCKGEADTPRQLVSNTGLPPLVRILPTRDDMRILLGNPLPIPALVLRGACDFIPETAAKAHVAAYRDARLETVSGAGHGLFDHETAFMGAVETFIAEKLSNLP